jgi:hypothetical protein
VSRDTLLASKDEFIAILRDQLREEREHLDDPGVAKIGRELTAISQRYIKAHSLKCSSLRHSLEIHTMRGLAFSSHGHADARTTVHVLRSADASHDLGRGTLDDPQRGRRRSMRTVLRWGDSVMALLR